MYVWNVRRCVRSVVYISVFLVIQNGFNRCCDVFGNLNPEQLKVIFVAITAVLLLILIIAFNIDSPSVSAIDNRTLTEFDVSSDDKTDMVDSYIKDRGGFRTEEISAFLQYQESLPVSYFEINEEVPVFTDKHSDSITEKTEGKLTELTIEAEESKGGYLIYKEQIFDLISTEDGELKCTIDSKYYDESELKVILKNRIVIVCLMIR